MAVGFDSVVVESVGAGAQQDINITPAVALRGLGVAINQSVVPTDVITSVIINPATNNIAMTRVVRGVSTGAEQGAAYAYFYGGTIPAGTLTIRVNKSDGTTVIQTVIQGYTGARTLEVIDFEKIDTPANLQNFSVTLTTGGKFCAGMCSLWHATNAVTGVTDGAGMTRLHDHDFTNDTGYVYRQTTPGTGNFTFSYTTAGNNSLALVAWTVSETAVTDLIGEMAMSFALKMAVEGATESPLMVFAKRPVGDVDRLELREGIEANGKALITPIGQLLSLEESRQLNGEHTITFDIAANHPALRFSDTPVGQINFRNGQVVRMLKTDGTWTEHRISAVKRQNSGGRRTRHIVARSILEDLGFRGMLTRTYPNGVVTSSFEFLAGTMEENLIEYILPALREAGQPFWEIGVLEHDEPIDMVYDGDTPLSALRRMAEVAGDLELYMVGSSTNYTLNLVKRQNQSAQKVYIRARKSLVDLGFTESSDSQATRIYGLGNPHGGVRPTSGSAEWIVHSVDPVPGIGYDLWLMDERLGPPPIKYSGQFTPAIVDVDDPNTETEEVPESYYIQYVTSELAQYTAKILETENVNDSWGISRVRIQATTPPPEFAYSQFRPDLRPKVKIVLSADLKENLFIDHPEMVEKYGVRVAELSRNDIPGTNNLLSNPLGRQWSANSQLPSGWTLHNAQGTPAIITRETDRRYWEHGGKAIRVLWPNVDPDMFIAAPLGVFPLRALGNVSYFARLTTLAGWVRVGLFLTRRGWDESNNITPAFFFKNGGSSHVYAYPDQAGQLEDEQSARSDIENTKWNQPEDLGEESVWDLTKYPLYGGLVELRIYPARDLVGTVEFIISGVQVTLSDRQMPLMEGNGGVRLHQAANERVGLYSTPAPTVQVDAVDLAMQSGMQFPYDPLVIGGSVEISDHESELVFSTRIMGWRRDWHRRLMPNLMLSNQREEITSLLAGDQSQSRHEVFVSPRGIRGLSFGT